jgi:hypothetical protein
MADRVTEAKRSIREMLTRYPVTFTFGHGGRHPYVEIETQDRRTTKVRFSGSNGSTFSVIKVRGDVRRALSRLGVAPWPDERAATRVGSLGDAMIEAVTRTTPIIQPKEDPAMAAATITPIKSASQASPPPRVARRTDAVHQASAG